MKERSPTSGEEQLVGEFHILLAAIDFVDEMPFPSDGDHAWVEAKPIVPSLSGRAACALVFESV